MVSFIWGFYAGEEGVEWHEQDEGEGGQDGPYPFWACPYYFFFFVFAFADDFFVFVLEPIADGQNYEDDRGKEVVDKGYAGD